MVKYFQESQVFSRKVIFFQEKSVFFKKSRFFGHFFSRKVKYFQEKSNIFKKRAKSMVIFFQKGQVFSRKVNYFQENQKCQMSTLFISHVFGKMSEKFRFFGKFWKFQHLQAGKWQLTDFFFEKRWPIHFPCRFFPVWAKKFSGLVRKIFWSRPKNFLVWFAKFFSRDQKIFVGIVTCLHGKWIELVGLVAKFFSLVRKILNFF